MTDKFNELLKLIIKHKLQSKIRNRLDYLIRFSTPEAKARRNKKIREYRKQKHDER